MAPRAALPETAMTITPGYQWRLDLDIEFHDGRPNDWPSWGVRMHVWGDGVQFSLSPGNGVRFEEVAGLDGADGPHTIPVIEMTAEQTESLRGCKAISYVIDLQEPGGVPVDYFAGTIRKTFSPPPELLR